jgi:hypothetical protein
MEESQILQMVRRAFIRAVVSTNATDIMVKFALMEIAPHAATIWPELYALYEKYGPCYLSVFVHCSTSEMLDMEKTTNFTCFYATPRMMAKHVKALNKGLLSYDPKERFIIFIEDSEGDTCTMTVSKNFPGPANLERLKIAKMDKKLKKAFYVCNNCVSKPPEGKRFPKCHGCYMARYCDKKCQREDWKCHKPHCDSLVKLWAKIPKNRKLYPEECAEFDKME